MKISSAQRRSASKCCCNGGEQILVAFLWKCEVRTPRLLSPPNVWNRGSLGDHTLPSEVPIRQRVVTAPHEVRARARFGLPEELHSTTDISHLTTLTTPSCWNCELTMNGQRCGASARLFEINDVMGI